MVNKKYTLLAVLLLTLGVTSYAQTSTFAWDWKDESVVPEKSKGQYQEFMQNKNPFPAKPRSAWEISAGIGTSMIFGDVDSKFGFAGSLSLRKAITNTFSVRFGYYGSLSNGEGKIYDYTGLSPQFTYDTRGRYYTPSYKTKNHELSTEILASINTFSNYRGDPKANIYVLGGLSINAAQVDFKSTNGTSYQHLKKATGLPMKDLLGTLNDNVLLFFGYSYGFGGAYKINSKFNIGLEQRFTTPFKKFDFLDAYSKNGGPDIISLTTLKFNYNLIK